jgi:hypothetical protein
MICTVQIDLQESTPLGKISMLGDGMVARVDDSERGMRKISQLNNSSAHLDGCFIQALFRQYCGFGIYCKPLWKYPD